MVIDRVIATFFEYTDSCDFVLNLRKVDVEMEKYKEYCLREMEDKDLELVLEWRNKPRICQNMISDQIIKMDEHRAWFERISHSKDSNYNIFEINGSPVGLVYFIGIDIYHSRTFWGFYLGEDHLPKGTGTKMCYLGLDFAFNKWSFRKINGEVFSFNQASINLHKKLGFKEEGRFKDHIFKNGNFEDLIFFSLFKDEWERNKSKIQETVFP